VQAVQTGTRWITYPAIMGSALAATYLLFDAGVSYGLTLGSVIGVSAIVVASLERVIPRAEAWQLEKRGALADLLHAGMSAGVVAPTLKVTLLALVTVAGIEASARLGFGLWPGSWPLAAQVALAIVVADLGAYTAHRLMHVTRTGWRIHVVHHSATRLNFLASARAHPFNAAFTLTMENVPLVFAGISPEALALVGVFKAVNGLVQHSNVDVRCGWLDYVLATAAVHRWHHSRVMEESNTNFGNTTMIWDHVFRTFRLPRDREPPVDVGLDGTNVPEQYLAHLGAPFVLSRYEDDE